MATESAKDLGSIADFLRRLQWAALALGVLWLVWLLAPILSPFVFAALLGWLGDPMVDRLEARGFIVTGSSGLPCRGWNSGRVCRSWPGWIRGACSP